MQQCSEHAACLKSGSICATAMCFCIGCVFLALISHWHCHWRILSGLAKSDRAQKALPCLPEPSATAHLLQARPSLLACRAAWNAEEKATLFSRSSRWRKISKQTSCVKTAGQGLALTGFLGWPCLARSMEISPAAVSCVCVRPASPFGSRIPR